MKVVVILISTDFLKNMLIKNHHEFTNTFWIIIVPSVCIYLRINSCIHMYKIYQLIQLKTVLKEHIDLRIPVKKIQSTSWEPLAYRVIEKRS